MGASFDSGGGGGSAGPGHSHKDTNTNNYLRVLCHRQGRLKVASELTKVFAFFSVLGAAELNINPGDAEESLVIAYVSVTSLFVANTVLVKLTVLWVSPQLRLAILLANDTRGSRGLNTHTTILPLGSLALILDIVWLMASAGGFVLFGVELVLAAWIKFGRFSNAIPIVAVAIMGPTLLLTSIVSVSTFARDRNKLPKVFNV